jgi:hypothetical protein
MAADGCTFMPDESCRQTSRQEIESQDRRLSDLVSSSIDESSTGKERRILFRAATSEVCSVFQINSQDAAGLTMDGRHSVIGSVEGTHAIDPGVHILPIERWEAKDAGKLFVERSPIPDISAVQFDS